MSYQKPSLLHYRVAQLVSGIVATVMFRRKFLRNEIKGKKGPFVVIANHQTALDFVNLIGATAQPMSFVISRSFFSTLPVKGFLEKMGVIPKQQFQTSVKDLKKIKSVIDAGQPLVIYPAGLMCEDGLSTPIPAATYKFLKWLDADVYVARCTGTYFVKPKWAKKMRPGKTQMDIYRLFTREELGEASMELIREKTEEALLFDAYQEQETLRIRYWGGENMEGLEHVLYRCPHCGSEYKMIIRDGNIICCTQCGYAQQSDDMGFLRNCGGIGPEIRYVSDWSRQIYEHMRTKLQQDPMLTLRCPATIQMVDDKKCKFVDVGQATLSLSREGFHLQGTLNAEATDIRIPIAGIPSLPFKPGKYVEIQQGNTIYRCVLDDGALAMEYINMVKLFYELEKEPVHA